jgi:predicted MFS family arabinose efflux permease
MPDDAQTPPSTFPRSAIIAAILTKTCFNSTIRFLFPFLAYFAEDMGITLELFSQTVLVAAEVSALVATFMSSWVSSYGSTTTCAFCCLVGGLSNVCVIFLPARLDSTPPLAVLCALRLIFGVTFNLLNSSVQSSIVHNVDEGVIGKITGIVESR